jgi:hypothetical protein
VPGVQVATVASTSGQRAAPEGGAVAWVGTSTNPTEEERAFLQRRVGVFGLVTAGLFFFFLAYRSAWILFGPDQNGLADPSYLYHALAGGCFLALWFSCRAGSRSVAFVRRAELLGLLAAVVAVALMGSAIPALDRPDYTLLLALTYALTARAIFVPSSARRSFLLALAVGVELVIGMYAMFSAPEVYATVMRTGAWPDLGSAPELAGRVAGGAAAWWVLTAFITTAASRVIYGLRRDVRVEMCVHHLHTPPEPPSQRLASAIEPALERLILCCLAKDPAERPASAAELEALLAACPDPEPWNAEQAQAWWQRLQAQTAPQEVPTELSDTVLTVDVRRNGRTDD